MLPVGGLLGGEVLGQQLAGAPVAGHLPVRGVELPGEFRSMTEEPRSGALLPEHLVAQQNLNGEGT